MRSSHSSPRSLLLTGFRLICRINIVGEYENCDRRPDKRLETERLEKEICRRSNGKRYGCTECEDTD
jgi:hypothetical protein